MPCTSLTASQCPPDYRKNYDCTKTAAPDFFCAITGNQASKQIIHGLQFYFLLLEYRAEDIFFTFICMLR